MSETYYQLILPMNVGTIIPKDSEVFLVEKIISLFNLSAIHPKKKTRAGRRPKIYRERLLMILIYAYLEGVYSSREIAKKVKRDVHYIYLAENKTISHDKISKFRKSLREGILLDIFRQFVVMLNLIKEIQFKNIYIDGTKIEANANKYSFVWEKVISKNEAKLQINVKKLLTQINNDQDLNVTYIFNEDEKITVELIDKILKMLNAHASKHKIEFKKGKGNRKTKLQKYVEELEEYLIRQSHYDVAKDIFQGRNSYSKTDNDATFMRMKEDHMKNGQLKAGYNVQIGIEGEYVVGVGIFNNRNDIDTLIPFLDDMKTLYGVDFENGIADSGYFSEKNISTLESRGMKYFIPYQSYYMEQTRKFKTNISKRENMSYDKSRDVYICANNKELVFTGITTDNRNSDYIIEKRNYKCQECVGCPLRKQCMPLSKKEDANKTITYSEKYENYKRKALENIKSEEGIQLRINRSIQVEGFFGVIKQNYDFRRFMLRGTENVFIEMLLVAFAYNIRKLYKKIQSGKLGTVTLHEVYVKNVA